MQSIIPEPLYYICRIVGRIAFPIFAYFIATGFYYTKNKSKYVITLLVFSIITQPIFYLCFNNVFYLNVLFTFLIAILYMWLYDKLFKTHKPYFIMLLVFLFIFMLVLNLLGITTDYGFLGVMLTLMFYIFKFDQSKQILMIFIFGITQFALNLINYTFDFFTLLPIFYFASAVLLNFYNGEKGNVNLKYLFYIFYPTHILVLWLIKILII